MPRITLDFSGYFKGIDIKKALDADFEEVDVSKWRSDDLIKALKAGQLNISLTECFQGDGDYEDFEAELDYYEPD